MKYRIISVSKLREPFYITGVKEYLKRLTPYAPVELAEGLEEKINPRASAQDIEAALRKEAVKIKKLLSPEEIVVALDIAGKCLSSVELAQQLASWNQSGKSRVNFIIGSAHGLAPELKKQADASLSFSPMTFPHQMAVLILAEQIYRSFKILKGEPYHH